jgi:hypothetical protein
MIWNYWSYRSKFYFKEKDIDFTKNNIDYNQFLLQEFFNADFETRKKISNFYLEKFGSRSLSYLNRKYNEWANGDYHLTDMIKYRILYIMPMFLNENAKNKLGINEFMVAIKQTISSFQSKQKLFYENLLNKNLNQKVEYIYKDQYLKINNLTLLGNFKYKVLTNEEKKEVLEICKYILKIKLQKKIENIYEDFNVFKSYLNNYKISSLNANYYITEYNLSLKIDKNSIFELELNNFIINDVVINNKYKTILEKYLASELVEIYKEDNRKKTFAILNDNDLSLFFSKNYELYKSNIQFESKSSFKGQGGFLYININFKPLKVLQSLILNSIIKILIYLVVVFLFFYILKYFKLYKILIFGGIIFGLVSLKIILEEISNTKSLINEYKSHGK